ncbi:hypothetical protein ABK040_013853 [Willaertia magna]
MRYHFIDKEPPQQLLSDFSALEEAPLDVFKNLAIASIRLISGESELTTVQQLLEALTPLSQNCNISVHKLANLIRSLTVFLQAAIGKNLKVDLIEQDCTNLGLSEDKSQIISQLWKKYFVAISRGVFSQNLTINPLIDMDWRFGVTASSSELNEVGTTFLQLRLTIDEGGLKKDVFLEMTLQQFYDFLHEMEKAQTTLDFFAQQ